MLSLFLFNSVQLEIVYGKRFRTKTVYYIVLIQQTNLKSMKVCVKIHLLPLMFSKNV